MFLTHDLWVLDQRWEIKYIFFYAILLVKPFTTTSNFSFISQIILKNVWNNVIFILNRINR